MLAADAEVGVDGVEGGLAERDEAALLPLAEGGDEALLPVDVGELEADDLADAQARGVEDVEDGAVAQAADALALGGVEDAGDLLDDEDLGEAAGDPGAVDQGARVGGEGALAEEEAGEAADGGEVAGGGPGAEALAAEGHEVGGDEGVVDAGPVGDAVLLGVGAELGEVDGVGRDALRGERALDAEVVQVGVDPGVEVHGGRVDAGARVGQAGGGRPGRWAGHEGLAGGCGLGKKMGWSRSRSSSRTGGSPRSWSRCRTPACGSTRRRWPIPWRRRAASRGTPTSTWTSSCADAPGGGGNAARRQRQPLRGRPEPRGERRRRGGGRGRRRARRPHAASYGASPRTGTRCSPRPSRAGAGAPPRRRLPPLPPRPRRPPPAQARPLRPRGAPLRPLDAGPTSPRTHQRAAATGPADRPRADLVPGTRGRTSAAGAVIDTRGRPRESLWFRASGTTIRTAGGSPPASTGGRRRACMRSRSRWPGGCTWTRAHFEWIPRASEV